MFFGCFVSSQTWVVIARLFFYADMGFFKRIDMGFFRRIDMGLYIESIRRWWLSEEKHITLNMVAYTALWCI